MKNFTRFCRWLLFRGAIRRWWIQRKARLLEACYITALSSESRTPIPNSVTGTRFSIPLRRILFIGDIMWEQEQLFPEIRKICDLNILDLHGLIANATDQARLVAQTLERYAKTTNDPNPDLIVFYARPCLLSEDVFHIIRNRWSCPLFGMNLDDRVEFFPYGIMKSRNDNYAQWICLFDVNLTSSLTAIDWYRTRNANVHYMPQGFHPDPRYMQPPVKADFTYPFSFVGSWKPERENLLDELEAHGIRPTLFGKGWKHSQWANDPQTIFRSSQLNLGIGYALASARIANAKGRDIECPATGACYLTTYHWELAHMFEIGKEVLCYRNIEELIELHTYYSRRPDACLLIAQAAHRRAHAEHTWEIRLRKLFKELGFKVLDS